MDTGDEDDNDKGDSIYDVDNRDYTDDEYDNDDIAWIMMMTVLTMFVHQFYEGYGQTECTAGCTLTLAGDWTAGDV